MPINAKSKALMIPTAAAAALAMLVSTGAFAQQGSPDQGPAEGSNNLMFKPHAAKRPGGRPLTVRPAPAPAPVAAAAGLPFGAIGTIVSAPFTAVGGALGGYGGPRKGGVTAVRYAGTGAKEAEIDEGFAQAVPVDKAGPIYVVENGDPTVSPLTFIGAPITATGALIQTPFRILQAPFSGSY